MDSTVVTAANKLIGLFECLRDGGHDVPDDFGCELSELSVFDEHYPVPLTPGLKEFLIRTSPKGYLDIGVLKTRGPSRLLEEQLNAVPLEGNRKHGFFGLGWWTGKADGDGWLYDLYNGRIYAVMLYYNDEPTREAVHALAYHEFAGFGEWVDFLIAKCRERGWLPEVP